MPRLANGRPWRGKFNLRGRTTLLFEVLDAGPVAIDAKGVKLAATIEPTFGALAPRADGKIPNRYDLAAGFYTLVLDPIGDAVGVVDVTLGTPGVAAAAPVQAPARVAISFGEQRLERDGSYLIIANVAPELLVGPRVVALPANLEKAPLPLWQGADETISIPLRSPKNGRIVAHDGRGGDVALTFGPETIDDAMFVRTVKIAPSGKARALGLAFVPDPAAKAEEKEDAKDADKEKQEESNAAPKPSKPSPGRAPLVAATGRPTYFDLARDETRELRFDVAQGGLYRVETLGRLQTAIKIGAAISTNLGAGENNGPGHNGLVTTYLRAGAYRAAVTAKESAGRLGFSAAPATLIETPKIVDEGQRAGDAGARQGGEHPAGNHARRPLHHRSSGRRPPLAGASGGFRGLAARQARRDPAADAPIRKRELSSRRVARGCRGAHGGAAATLHAGAGTRRPRSASPAVRGAAKAAMARAAGGRRRARPRCVALFAARRRGCRAVDHRRHDGRDFARRQGERRQGGGRARFSGAPWRRRLPRRRPRDLPRRPARLRDFAEIQGVAARRRALRRFAGEGRLLAGAGRGGRSDEFWRQGDARRAQGRGRRGCRSN